MISPLARFQAAAASSLFHLPIASNFGPGRRQIQVFRSFLVYDARATAPRFRFRESMVLRKASPSRSQNDLHAQPLGRLSHRPELRPPFGRVHLYGSEAEFRVGSSRV